MKVKGKRGKTREKKKKNYVMPKMISVETGGAFQFVDFLNWVHSDMLSHER